MARPYEALAGQIKFLERQTTVFLHKTTLFSLDLNCFLTILVMRLPHLPHSSYGSTCACIGIS